MSIETTIYDGNLLPNQQPTDEAVDRYAEALADAVRDEYDRTTTVHVARNTSGGASEWWLPADLDDEKTRMRLDEIAGEVWENWCEALSESDVVEP